MRGVCASQRFGSIVLVTERLNQRAKALIGLQTELRLIFKRRILLLAFKLLSARRQTMDRLLNTYLKTTKTFSRMFRQGGRVVRSTIIKSVIFTVAAVVAITASVASAQEAGRVAILDVAKVFKDNASFDAKVKAIKAEADKLKLQITAEQDRIKAEVMKLRGMEAGPQRNQMEADLEQQHTRLRTTTRQNESELLNREARVYFDTYNEMQAVVEGMAKEYGLSLVLRFDSESIDPNNRNEVIKGVNRAVVFHRQLDLTTLVSKELNARMANTPATTR